ncbi:hypothetical protein K4F52_002334 [Lecanicillium sp. MT-2017a]|nr:hypothetical protein K4F52_002334 [Lecanicillium sp. MT-2017a]
MTNHANATVLGLTTIRAFGQTERYRERMLTLVDKSATVGLHVQLGGCWGKTRLDLLSCVFVTGTAAAMAYRHVDAATTGLTITLALQLRAAMASLLGQVSMTSMGLAAAERVFALREIPKEVGQETPLSKGERPTKGSLEVNSLEVRYMADLEPVLKGVFFSIQAGQRLGIVGRTGAGKTTLTNALLRFVEASKGSISIGGVDISQLSLRDLRSAVGIIPQDPFLFSGTLRENLDPSGSKSDKALIAALQRMRLIKDDDLAGAFSDLGMLIHVGGANLSHGQRQLICLARAMVKEHSVLILDEATSSVDNATDELVQEIIKAEFGAKTVVVVAHKLMTAACMDKVLILSHGEAVELGSPRELLEKKGVFWDMVDQSGQKMEIESAVISSVDPNI